MKARSRIKTGSRRGNPAYRTPSFFRNRPQKPTAPKRINKAINQTYALT